MYVTVRVRAYRDAKVRSRFGRRCDRSSENEDVLVAQIADEHCCRLGERCDSILLNLSIWREDTFGKALNHGTWHRKILRG